MSCESPAGHRAARSGYVLNVYSHLLGFCLGFVAPYAALRLADDPA